MKVRELIELLQKEDPEALVVADFDDHSSTRDDIQIRTGIYGEIKRYKFVCIDEDEMRERDDFIPVSKCVCLEGRW